MEWRSAATRRHAAMRRFPRGFASDSFCTQQKAIQGYSSQARLGSARMRTPRESVASASLGHPLTFSLLAPLAPPAQSSAPRGRYPVLHHGRNCRSDLVQYLREIKIGKSVGF